MQCKNQQSERSLTTFLPTSGLSLGRIRLKGMNPPLEELTTIRTRRKAHFIFDSTKWKWFTDFGEFCGQNHNPSNKDLDKDKASRTYRSKVQAETRFLVCQESCYNYALVYFWTCLLCRVNSCDPGGYIFLCFVFPIGHIWRWVNKIWLQVSEFISFLLSYWISLHFKTQ